MRKEVVYRSVSLIFLILLGLAIFTSAQTQQGISSLERSRSASSVSDPSITPETLITSQERDSSRLLSPLVAVAPSSRLERTESREVRIVRAFRNLILPEDKKTGSLFESSSETHYKEAPAYLEEQGAL